MLSKLEFFESSGKISDGPAERQALEDALARHFSSAGRAATITPASGGTLGVCFHVDDAGARRFVKTHLPSARARANLTKEGDILVQLYGDAVVLDRVEVRPEGGSARLCLLMAELSPLSAPMGADEAAAMVRHYTKHLHEYHLADMPAGWDFEQYVAHGRRAVAALEQQVLIGRETAAELERLLDLLQRALGTFPRALCHGDFGPRNVMTDGAQPIAIDWEDAFWGVAGYDYLYWLTFMDNRPFLRNAAFERTGLDTDVERAILALVVLLKSYTSVRAGTHVHNKVPIDMRIIEVLALPRPI